MSAWQADVAAVLKKLSEDPAAFASDGQPYIDISETTYDPVTARINSKVTYSTQAIQDMLRSGWAKIENGEVVLLDAPLPPEQRTTHTMTILVRQTENA